MSNSTRNVLKPRCQTGLGLMGMTWRPTQTPDEQAFDAIKAAIAAGATVWSTASFYGTPEPTAGLSLLRRYFEKNPEDADKVTLFVKSCVDASSMFLPAMTKREEVLASADECIKLLGGFKKIDIFGPSRIDKNVPLEETMGALRDLAGEDKIGGVGLSEVGAETIERANGIYPLSVVEVEFSLWSTELLTNGVAAVCKKLDIPILAYSPLGRGFLTGRITKPDDIPEGDIRRWLDRFQPQHFDKNLQLVNKVKSFAAKRGVTPAQLALAWVRAHQDSPQGGTIIPIPGATARERVEENVNIATLTPQDKAELDEVISSFRVSGGRYTAALESKLWA